MDVQNILEEGVKAVTNDLTTHPEVLDGLNSYIKSDKCPNELKAYILGEKDGFAKGLIGVAFGALLLYGLSKLFPKNENGVQQIKNQTLMNQVNQEKKI